jgi:hypothetical protein
MKETYYKMHSTDRLSGSNVSFQFPDMRLPTGIQIGDTVEMRIQNFFYNRGTYDTNQFNLSYDMSITGTDFNQLSPNNNASNKVALIYFNSSEFHFNNGDTKQKSYRFRVYASSIRFEIDIINLLNDKVLVNANFAPTYFSFMLKKVEE